MKKTSQLTFLFPGNYSLLFIFCFTILINPLIYSQTKGELPAVFFKNFDLDDYKASCQNWDMLVSPKGILCVANNSGLLTFDGNNWKLNKTSDKSAIKNIVFHNDTLFTSGDHAIGFWVPDEKGTLIYSSLEEKPAHIRFREKPNSVPYPLPPEVIEAQPSTFATLDGINYVGTLSNGIFVLDNEGYILAHLTDRNLLQDNIIHNIYVDAPGQIWIAYDNGLSFVTLDPALSFLGKRNQLGMLQDASLIDNELYIKTHKGYYKRDLKAGAPFIPLDEERGKKYLKENPPFEKLTVNDIFTTTNGLDEFTASTRIYPAGNGKYWLTLDNELALYIPGEPENQQECRILFDSFKLNLVTHDTRIFPCNDSLYIISTMQGIILLNTEILKRSSVNQRGEHRFMHIYYTANDSISFFHPGSEKIILPHNFQRVNLYVGTSVKSANNHISYQIEGLDNEWSPWQTDGQISFLKLPEGKYKLKVRKYVSTGTFPEIDLIIEVPPPWYATVWAYILYVIFLCGFLLIIICLYLKSQKKRQKQQQEKKQQEEEKHLQSVRNQILETELVNKNNELMLQTSILLKKGRLIHTLSEELEKQKETLGDRYPNKLYMRLKNMMNESLNDQSDWDAFENYFNSAHQNFIVRLQQKFDDITPGDLRVCCLLKMNLSTKEIASLLNISVRAVEVRRYRLRKRMGLEGDINLVEFLMNF